MPQKDCIKPFTNGRYLEGKNQKPTKNAHNFLS